MSKLQTIKFPLQNRSHLQTSRFADGKYRQATVATIVPLRKFCRFLRKKWLAAAWANSKTNLRPPGRDFRCRWLTSLFIKQIKIDICTFPYCKYSSFMSGCVWLCQCFCSIREHGFLFESTKKEKHDVFITGFTKWSVLQQSRSNNYNATEIAVVL